MYAQIIGGKVKDILPETFGHADQWVEDDGTAEVGCDWSEAQGFHNQTGEPPDRVLAWCFVKFLKANKDNVNLIIPQIVKDKMQRYTKA